jgi:PKD repeat protein/type 1 glutamine amidotransferase
VFSKTTGFRHDSIPDGIAAIQKLGQENNFTVDATEDDAFFTDANLAQYDVVVFVSTTGDPLGTQAEKDAFQRYIQAGGGFVGIHAAADSGYTWPWYGKLVGAYFKSHPAIQSATVKIEDPAHPSMQGLPLRWTRTDEWYNYQTNPRGAVHVLAALDETSYDVGSDGMGFDHPITWCQNYDGGRSWYTGLGHTKESYTEPEFLKTLLGGLQTAAGVVNADCSASLDSSFQKVTLDDSTSNPMMLDVAADGRVFYIDRLGDVKVVKPSGGTVLAAHLDVFTANESGGLGLALDPKFDTNHWLYVYYSPTGKDVDRLSRFTVTGDALDMGSEQVVLEAPVQRAECCHHGGGMVFDAKSGDLWLATGDNTNPFASDGYAPIDERAGREAWDAQRSAANTNSLSGKVLRIHPESDGTYTIPDGNLFAPGTAKTRPEVYAMGFRNPFRIGIDPKTGKVMVANYGPDAGSPSPTRGPENTVEWDILNQPGNYGWPYCIGDNKPYIDYDFATGQSGSAFDCATPVNNSPNNTGLTDLPAAIPAMVYYHYSADPAFPELGGGGAPMAGPVYRYDTDLNSDRKWPAYWDGKAIFGEWNQNKLYSFQLNDDASQLLDINQIFGSMSFLKPMDMKFGPDGALYLIEWGSGFGGDNTDSAIYRIDYVQGNRVPIAKVQADKTDGPAPLTVAFSSEGSRDPDGTTITYAWDLDGDGTTDSTDPAPSHTYSDPGNYTATLTVTDGTGKTGTASVIITVGNTTPAVTIDGPPTGGFFDWGDQVKYKVTVTDPEDGTIDCDTVQVQAILGHDSHGHPLDQYHGCSGTVQTTLSSGHTEGDNVFYVLEASYTDKGGAGGANPLTGRAQVILQPKHKQAEFFTSTGRTADGAGTGTPGVQTEPAGDDQGGGEDIGFIEDGDWWTFDPVDLTGIDSIRFRAASASTGGTIQVRWNAPDGPVVGSADVPNTGGWQTYQDFSVNLTQPPGASGKLYFVVRRPAGSDNTGGLLNVNWVDFVGKGLTDNQRPAVTATATPTSGTTPLTVDFSATATDPEGDTPLTYKWDFGVAGAPQPTTPDASYTYTAAGTYTATVTVTDAKGAITQKTLTIRADAPNPACDPGQPRPAPNDEFDGTALDGCRWDSIVRPDPAAARLTGGNLEIDTSQGDIYGSGNSGPKNFILQRAPAGDWTLETKVDGSAFNQAYHQGGLLVYADDGNYVKFDYITDSATARRIELRSEIGDTVQDPQPQAGDLTQGVWWLRLVKVGDTFHGFASADGQTWTEVGTGVQNSAVASNAKAGVFAFGVDQTASVTAKFDYFHLSTDLAAPTTTATTDVGLPGTGWFTGPVTVTLAAQDAGSGVDRTEYALDGGAWTAYGGPVTVSGDGAHTLQYRSADKAGNVEDAKTLPVKIDATAPLTTAAFAPGNDDGWHMGAVPVTLSAADATSGLAATEYKLDDGAWTPYTEPVNVSGDGEHTVLYRSTDQAGNVETDKAATVKIDASGPTVLVSGVADGQLYGDSQDVRIGWQATDATSGLQTVSGTLDDRPFLSGTLQALYELSLGRHRIAVTATDKAGNQTSVPVEFFTATSLRDMANLIDRFRATGRLTQATANKLQNQLTKARLAEATGKDARAIKELEKFKTMTAAVSGTEVTDTLVRDANAMIVRLGGTPAGLRPSEVKALQGTGWVKGDATHR